MQINKMTLSKGILSLAALTLITSCVDDKYDLTDVDTSTRISVNDLKIPIELKDIELESLVKLEDNENIDLVTDPLTGREYYAIQKGGDIESSTFSVDPVSVTAPTIPSTNISISVPYNLNASGFALPEIEIPFDDKRETAPYSFKMDDIDEALKALYDVKTQNSITIKVELNIPAIFTGGSNSFAFKDVRLQLPTDLIIANNDYSYDKTSGQLTVPNLSATSDGKASFILYAQGLDLGEKGTIKENPVTKKGSLNLSGEVGVLGGKMVMNLSNVNISAGEYNITANYYVSNFVINSVSGKIDYKVKDFDNTEIELSDLPEFLDNDETSLKVANPSIKIDIKNPIGRFAAPGASGLKGTGKIKLISSFKNGTSVDYSSKEFTIAGEETKLSFGQAADGYQEVAFSGLGDILTNPNVASGLPEKIEVGIDNLSFTGDVKDFILSNNIGEAKGSYEFNAPLGFGEGTKIIYETTEGDWGGDDIDKINISKISVQAKCTTNLPIGIALRVDPVDKEGNIIPVKEHSDFIITPMSNKEPISLIIEEVGGNPIRNFDGLRFRAIITQDHDGSPYTDAIGPDLHIKLTELTVGVSGYYDYVDEKED